MVSKHTYIILLTTLFLMGASNGTMDKLQFHYGKSVFTKLPEHVQTYFNPDISWKLKYKNANAGDYRPKFPLSTTILVAFTDAWHLLKLIWEALLFYCIYLATRLRKKITYEWLLISAASYKAGFAVMWYWLLNL